MINKPDKTSHSRDSDIYNDLENYRTIAISNGASASEIIRVENIVVEERVRAKCRIPKCPEYNTNLHCPPFSLTASQTKEILKDYNFAIAVRIDVASEYAVGQDIHKCVLSSKLDKHGKYIQLGKKYKKMFYIVSEIEAAAFYDQHYLSLGFAAGSCKNVFCFQTECQGLKPGKGCRHALRARPSMEAVGFDVFKMAKNLGWKMVAIGGRSKMEEVPCASLVGIILIA